jgi:N-acetyl-anhydromuramyl-L-alanine amidase AmpD
MGIPTFRGPDAQTAVADGDAALPSRLGGGLYVQLTGLHAKGYLQVRTLQGVEVWVADVTESGGSSLCFAHPSVMRVCGKDDAPQAVPVVADFSASGAPPVTVINRGSLVQLWGYFEDRGRWTFVETRGKVGFVRSEDLCHENSRPPTTQATEHFAMIAAPASPDCYQAGRERGADEIRRIVIHNSEASLQETIALFQKCDPGHPRSAHVGIDRDGKIYRFVEDKFAAFHTGGTSQSGGFNSTSLGIELIAEDKPGLTNTTSEQEQSLLQLIHYWSKEYAIAIPASVFENSTRSTSYNDLEYWDAPVTLHRLVSAGRRTDCPKFTWEDSVQGDEAFFAWRRKHLGDIELAGEGVGTESRGSTASPGQYALDRGTRGGPSR